MFYPRSVGDVVGTVAVSSICALSYLGARAARRFVMTVGLAQEIPEEPE